MIRSRIVALCSPDGKFKTIKETLNEEGKVIDTCEIATFGDQKDLGVRCAQEIYDDLLREEIKARRYVCGDDIDKNRAKLSEIVNRAFEMAKNKISSVRIKAKHT